MGVLAPPSKGRREEVDREAGSTPIPHEPSVPLLPSHTTGGFLSDKTCDHDDLLSWYRAG